MKNVHKVTFLFVLFLSGMLMVPIISQQIMASNNTPTENPSVPAQTGYIPGTIRVAIYNEPNFTAASYDTSGGDNHNNVTYLKSVLDGYGYEVSLLDLQDIQNHELKTADYDVLVLADNNPRNNITKYILDFWTGGGGILALDGSGVFLCYFGILPPEAQGTTGQSTYWSYSANDILINQRHPITKSYAVDDAFITTPVPYNYLGWNFAALQATSIGDDLTKVASTAGDSNRATILAFNPSNRGGRVVTIAFDLVHGNVPELEQFYADSVEWLAPSPRGRILFDYVHNPYYGIDGGDPSRYGGARFASLRDIWVNHTFTLDKLYPEETDEITSSILAKYDILMMDTPYINFTTSEKTAIRNWISAGGGLLILGDWNSFSADNARINDLLAVYDLNITTTQYPVSTFTTTNSTFHPINEGVSTVEFSGGNYINVEGDAIPLWMDDNGYIAGIQNIGSGRIFLASDLNFIGNYIDSSDNAHLGLNIANWLCSGDAEILLYTDGASLFGPSYNYYKSPAALALNELSVDYYMSNDRDYFNESLGLQSWELVIIDANYYSPTNSYSLIRDHLESGGKLIWRDFMFRYSSYDSMWNYLGFSGLDSSITSGPPSVYLWDPDHSIFNLPVDYGADNITTSDNVFNTDFTYVSLLDNATALAGISSSYDENQSAIVLSVGGRAICNQFSITQYLDDTDDSTYADGFEIWMNEIAYMLKPTINHPSDIEYTEGATGNAIAWIGNSKLPFEYNIKMNGTTIASGGWSGGTINYNIDGLTNGTYIYSITLFDRAGYSISDAVTVSVLPFVTNTTTTTTGGGIPFNTMILIIAGVVAVAVIVIIVILMKRKPTK